MKKFLICITYILLPFQIWADSFITKEGISVEYYMASGIGGFGIFIGTKNNKSAINTDTEGSITIPEEIEGTFDSGKAFKMKVIGIASRAFQSCSKLDYISLPSSVKEIGSYAFCLCSSLRKFDIPEGVTSIETAVFKNCTKLSSITIPNDVTIIGSSAFNGCSGLASITIPEKVTNIEDHAFASCSGLTSITIPSKVTRIGDSAFGGCSGLTSITIPEFVTIIEAAAFRNCTSLTTINIPEDVTSIGENAFFGCSSLATITIPKNVESIGTQAFYGCSNLTSIYSRIQEPFALPNAVFKKDRNSTNKATLYVPYNRRNIYNSTSGWSDDVYIKESPPMTGDTFTSLVSCGLDSVETDFLVTSDSLLEVQLGYGNKIAFPAGLLSNNCDIPSTFVGFDDYSFTITSIGNNAFKDCSELTTLSIPNSINIIENAFSGCTNLNSTTVNWRKPSDVVIDSECFDDIPGDAVLYVPAGTAERYADHEVWSKFADIIESGPISVGDITACNGSQVLLPILLKNKERVRGFQFRLTLPEGVEAQEENGIVQTENTERMNDFIVIGRKDSETPNSFIFAGLSLSGKTIAGNEGTIMNIKLSIDDDTPIGLYEIKMEDINITTSTYETLEQDETWGDLKIQDYMSADVNGDNVIDALDASLILQYVAHKFGDENTDFIKAAADTNNDNVIDALDASLVLQHAAKKIDLNEINTTE